MLEAFALAAVLTATHVERTIDAFCERRSQRARASVSQRLVRLVGDSANTAPGWNPATPGALERVAHDPDIYSEVAEVYRVDAHVAIVAIAARSLELREDTSYCFRADGSLARVRSTSSGANNVDDEARYFDAGGNSVGSSSRLGLLYPQPGASVSPDLKPAKPDVYLRVDALPFFALLDS